MKYFPILIKYTDLNILTLIDSIDDIDPNHNFIILKTNASEADLDPNIIFQSYAKQPPCKCGSSNIATISMKHDDRTSIIHKSTNLQHHSSYMPHIGILGGDQTTLQICLDCGNIQNWQPINQIDFIKSIFQ